MHENSAELQFSNVATVGGVLEDDFQYSHDSHCETFYKAYIRATRLSGTDDILPIIVPESLLMRCDGLICSKGTLLNVSGELRSRNVLGRNNKKHVHLYLFAQGIAISENNIDLWPNNIQVNGVVCKDPKFRVTPTGRNITNLLIAVNRTLKSRSDYLPCIAWGYDASYAANLKVGDKVTLNGRIQSRDYTKKLSTYQLETCTTYEVSIAEISKFADSELNSDM